MSYCPQCGVEYRDDAKECLDCGAALAAGRPPAPAKGPEPTPNAKVVPIRVFRGPTAMMEAELARNVLETQGIPAILPGETSAEILPGVDIVQVVVNEQDAEEAAGILASYFDRETASDAPEPIERSDTDIDPERKPGV